jgi:hypothetical protein
MCGASCLLDLTLHGPGTLDPGLRRGICFTVGLNGFVYVE